MTGTRLKAALLTGAIIMAASLTSPANASKQSDYLTMIAAQQYAANQQTAAVMQQQMILQQQQHDAYVQQMGIQNQMAQQQGQWNQWNGHHHHHWQHW